MSGARAPLPRGHESWRCDRRGLGFPRPSGWSSVGLRVRICRMRASAGMRPGTRSGLWSSMVDAIAATRPRLVVWENVRGALSKSAFSRLKSGEGRMGGRADGLFSGLSAVYSVSLSALALTVNGQLSSFHHWSTTSTRARLRCCRPLKQDRNSRGTQSPGKRRAGGHQPSIADVLENL